LRAEGLDPPKAPGRLLYANVRGCDLTGRAVAAASVAVASRWLARAQFLLLLLPFEKTPPPIPMTPPRPSKTANRQPPQDITPDLRGRHAELYWPADARWYLIEIQVRGLGRWIGTGVREGRAGGGPAGWGGRCLRGLIFGGWLCYRKALQNIGSA
jgi:hypothetical protein